MPLYPQRAASQGSCPILYFFVVFTSYTFQSIKELGTMSTTTNLISGKTKVDNCYLGPILDICLGSGFLYLKCLNQEQQP